MTIALLVLQLLLAAVFLVAGLRKFTHPTPEFRQLLGPGGYVTVGLLELAAVAALALPTVTGIATALVPVAALGLVLLMAGAALVNRRMGRGRDIPTNVVLLALAAAVAVATLPALG
jgi:uncharacterized membrane protein YphA (DoxX/SURF4 family)